MRLRLHRSSERRPGRIPAMSRLHRVLTLLSFLTAYSALVLETFAPAVSASQLAVLQTQQPDTATPAPVEPVTLPVEHSLRKKLDAAQDYIQAGQWLHAVRLLQLILDSPEDSFLERPERDGKSRGHWVGARAEAERLLASLPAAGLEVYQVTYNAQARKLYGEAARGGDREGLHEVARRYLYTAAGAEALALIGTLELDRGQAATAAICFRRLLELPGGDRLPPQTLGKAVLAFHLAG